MVYKYYGIARLFISLCWLETTTGLAKELIGTTHSVHEGI